jgi:hypothetical protein
MLTHNEIDSDFSVHEIRRTVQLVTTIGILIWDKLYGVSTVQQFPIYGKMSSPEDDFAM